MLCMGVPVLSTCGGVDGFPPPRPGCGRPQPGPDVALRGEGWEEGPGPPPRSPASLPSALPAFSPPAPPLAGSAAVGSRLRTAPRSPPPRDLISFGAVP